MDTTKIDQLETEAYIAYHEWQDAMAEQRALKKDRYEKLIKRLEELKAKHMSGE